MSNGSAKLIFVVALVINCILFSQSRYAHVSPHTGGSLSFVKRALELSRKTGLYASFSEDQARCTLLQPDIQILTTTSVPADHFASRPAMRPRIRRLSTKRIILIDTIPPVLLLLRTSDSTLDFCWSCDMAHILILHPWNQRIGFLLSQPRNDCTNIRTG